MLRILVWHNEFAILLYSTLCSFPLRCHCLLFLFVISPLVTLSISYAFHLDVIRIRCPDSFYVIPVRYVAFLCVSSSLWLSIKYQGDLPYAIVVTIFLPPPNKAIRQYHIIRTSCLSSHHALRDKGSQYRYCVGPSLATPFVTKLQSYMIRISV